MTALPTETITQQFRHEVRVVHATTGNPILGFTASLVHPRRPGWTVSRSGHRIIVSVLERHDDPAIVPQLTIDVTDAATKARLEPFGAAPDVARPDLVHHMTVDLNAPLVTVQLQPAPSSLLLTIVDRTGTELTGLDVELRGVGGVNLPLIEGASGVYEALDEVWAPEFATSDVLIDTVIQERPLTINPTVRVMEIWLIRA